MVLGSDRVDLEARLRLRDEASRGLRTFGDSVGRTESQLASMSRVVSALTIGLGTAGLTAAIGSTISAASNLEESVNAVNVVFGSASSTILQFGQNAASSVGLAASQFNQLSTTTGALLQNFGLSSQEAADQTLILTQRAADMASVFNTDVTDALSALNAALRGETEPIRRYAADVTDATLQTFALSQGIQEAVSSMSQQEKALLRLNAILSQTESTSGDFTNTSDSLANQVRILQAEFENLRAELGQELLPVATDFTGVLLDLTRSFNESREASGQAHSEFDRLRTLMGDLPGPIREAVVVMAALSGSTDKLQGSFAAINPHIARRLGVPALVDVISELRDEQERLSGVVPFVDTGLIDMGDSSRFLREEMAGLDLTLFSVNDNVRTQAALTNEATFNLEEYENRVRDLNLSQQLNNRTTDEARRELALYGNLLDTIGKGVAEQFAQGMITDAQAVQFLENAVIASNIRLRNFQTELVATTNTGIAEFNRIQDTFARLNRGARRGVSFNAAGLFAPGIPGGGGDQRVGVFVPGVSASADIQDPVTGQPRIDAEEERVIFMDANGMNRQQAQIMRDVL